MVGDVMIKDSNPGNAGVRAWSKELGGRGWDCTYTPLRISQDVTICA